MPIATTLSTSTAVSTTPPRHDPDRVEVQDVAFDAVLALAQSLVGVGTSGLGPKASPSQMFEPAANNSRESTTPSAQNQHTPDRYDRTSVTVRRNAAPAAIRESSPTTQDPADSVRVQPHRSTAPTPNFLREDGAGGPRVSSKMTPMPGNHASRPLNTTMNDTNVSSMVERHSAAPTREISSAGGASTKNSAQRVAQLLAVSRPGGVESTRGVASSASSASTDRRAAQQKAAAQDSKAPQRFGTSPNESSGRVSSSRRSLFDELVQSFRLRAGGRRSSARLQLNPPELGRLDVDVRVVDERIEIDVRTQTKAARQLLEGRAATLTAALEQHGIHVERFEVSAESADPDGRAGFDGGASNETAHEEQSQPSDTTSTLAGVAAVDGDSEVIADGGEPVVGAVAETRLDISV